jgi:pimeloyl-ACP methyl ester carboxylesterase
MKFLILILVGFTCACVSRKAKLDSHEVINQGLVAPAGFEIQGVQARYWIYNDFVIHFVTNVNEQNKNLAPIIYVHGLGGSLEGFAPLINILHRSKSSRPFYAIDLPPFGKSAMQKGELSIHSYKDMLQDFIAALAVPKINLVCHSMGGQVCIEYALNSPGQIQLLTLISPAGTYEKSPFVNGVTNHFAGINVGTVDAPNAIGFGDLTWYDQNFARRMITDNPLILVGIESFRENFHARIQNLKTKTLIIWGRNDQIFSYANGLYLKENIEHSTLYVIEGADHTSFKTHPALIANLIQKYL